MASSNVDARVADKVAHDIVQDSDSGEEGEEPEWGETEREYCFTPMEGSLGELVECPNCELCRRTMRRSY